MGIVRVLIFASFGQNSAKKMKKFALGILQTKWRKQPGLKNYANRTTLIVLVHTYSILYTGEPLGPFVTTLVDVLVHKGLWIYGFVSVVFFLIIQYGLSKQVFKSFLVWMDWHLGYQTKRDIDYHYKL